MNPSLMFSPRGRLVASRRVRAGQVVLVEEPAMVSPSGDSLTSTGLCLECLALLDTEDCPLCEGRLHSILMDHSKSSVI